jgi:hypothetical protein
MENKNSLEIRKYITLMESIDKNIDLFLIESEQINEQGTALFRDVLPTLGNILKQEKGLFSTLKQSLPNVMKRFNTVDDLIAAAGKEGGITANEGLQILKQVGRNSPEIASKLKTYIKDSPKLAEIAKEIYPKGISMRPVSAAKEAAAIKGLQQYGYTAQEAKQVLQGAYKSSGGVSTRAVQRAAGTAVKGGTKNPALAQITPKAAQNAATQVPKATADTIKKASRLQTLANGIKRYTIDNKWFWIAGGAGAIWWLLSRGDESAEVVDEKGFPFPPVNFGTCFADNVQSGVAKPVTTTSGQRYLLIKQTGNEIYDKVGGLKFYSNNRVFTFDNSKKGTWSCSGDNVKVIGNTAQFNFPINENTILEQETVLGDITVTWDETQKSDGTIPPKKSTYRDCTVFPYTFGCRSEVIKEVQKCLGMESKYQTGNFGPITLRNLKSKRGEDTITKEVYDSIKSACGGSGSESTPVRDDTPIEMMPSLQPQQVSATSSNEPQMTQQSTETPDELYNRLVREKLIRGRNQNNRLVYKGPDLSDEDTKKLTQSMSEKGFRLSRDNEDYRAGDKIIYKRD